MTLVAVPQWTAPDDRQVIDGIRLAHAHARHRGGWADKGRAAALDWAITGDGSPTTGRTDEEPPGREVVAAELRATTPNGPDRETAAWAAGVSDALLWLLGYLPTPGFDLPRRHPDGSTWTADELLAETPPPAGWIAERRRGARQAAEVAAARYRRLADLADSVH